MEWQWSISQGVSPNVHVITVSSPEPIRFQGNEFRVLVTSDRHFDSPHSDRVMQKRHMEEAKVGGWPVVDLGDFFDLMQGRHDNRRDPRDNKYANRIDYYDAVVEDAAEFFAPYAQNIALLGRWNHDQKVLKHEGTDTLRRFAAAMQREGGSTWVGGYGGWLFVRFTDGRSKGPKWTDTKRIKYFHGAGGGGPVTRGTIQTARKAVYLPDAHAVIGGHIHEDWSLIIPRERVSRQGRVHLDEQLHLCIPSYKEEYGTGYDGWHVERGAPPKPVGAAWLRFTLSNNQVDGPKTRGNVYRINIDAERAR